MKVLILTLIITASQFVLADEPFDQKVYTPNVVIDRMNTGQKGAVQLLWQKNQKPTRYEVEVSNGHLVYSQVSDKHFHHVMLFFNKDYQWRVREVSAEKTTEFSPWKPLKVIRKTELAQNQNYGQPGSVDSEKEVEEYLLDTGD